jgi:Cys-rich protein (TIGR01571 family)
MRDMNTGPVGAWKDGLCDCFKYGICHPHLWLACCFRSIALAQVMVRMRLNWCGEAASVSAAAKTFKTVFVITVIYYALDYSLSIASNTIYAKYNQDAILSAYVQDYTGYEDYFEQDESTNTDGTTAAVLPVGFYVVYYIRQILGYAFWFYFVIAAVRTRRAIREKHAIPEQTCVGCEDVVCVACCGCCTVMQMSRHTADYDKYPAQCCTETGLPSHVDAMS